MAKYTLERFFRFVDENPKMIKALSKSNRPKENQSYSDTYKSLCKNSRFNCLHWASMIFEGMNERIVFQWVRRFWDQTTQSDYLPAIGKAIKAFHKEHFPIWVISESPRWIAEIGALRYGIRPEKVVSVYPITYQNKITDRLKYRIPLQIRKVFLVNQLINTQPYIVFGHNYLDYEALSLAGGMHIVVNPPKEQTDPNNLPFITAVKNLGWHIQHFDSKKY